MKLLLLTSISLLFTSKALFGQCSVQLNDSLYSNYDFVLNATNVTGQAPFQFNWTITDGNGMSIPYTQNTYGDSVTISSQTIMNSYGCIIYQLCMTDALNCTTCTQGDTSALQVPFNCFSQFSTSLIAPNTVSVTLLNNIPQFLIQQQFMSWTDGNGQAQGMPYMGPGTIVNYTPGSSNTSNQFFLCIMSNLTTGGCISCDSIPYSYLGLEEEALSKLKIYPNPSSTITTVSSEVELSNAVLTEMSGRIITTLSVAAKKEIEIDLSQLPIGMYLIDLTTVQGNHIQKLIQKN
ncbi:MAG: hypothetical protein RLZ33_1276 [Bacteroidota bacterium]|jgi:hypothetical protein